MNDLEELRKENTHLKNLLEQVYEMSCLEDMISDGCLDRNDDEMLGHNLLLKSEIFDALKEKKITKDIKNINLKKEQH